MRTTIKSIILASILSVALISCYDDTYDNPQPRGTVEVHLTIQTRASSDNETFEEGSQWENYIDVDNGDYRIYFFTYESDDTNGGTLIAKFTPTEVTITPLDDTNYVEYSITGQVSDDLTEHSSFRVVVLANWGNYPSSTIGTTTIDDLVEGDNTTFSLIRSFTPSDGAHIPFYGVHEYTGVDWSTLDAITLTDNITLLRAMAKVEVVLPTDLSFNTVSVVNCNGTGYCAPQGVYLKEDYDTGSSTTDFTKSLHLVNGSNSLAQVTEPCTKSTTTNGEEVWTIYLTEHDNTGTTGYSYISATQEGITDSFRIYFGEYTDGVCTAYESNGDTSQRFNIFRNYYYRFSVFDMTNTSSTRSTGSTPCTQAEVRYGW